MYTHPQELVAASSAFGYDEDDVEDLFKTSDLVGSSSGCGVRYRVLRHSFADIVFSVPVWPTV